MATISLPEMAKHMRQIDICMMTTQPKRGSLNSRPMSNNKDVTYSGDSYYFTYEKSKKVKDILANPNVSLNFEGTGGLYISISGKAKLIRDKGILEEHWVDSLDQWFENGVNTKGIVLIHVKGTRLSYWHKMEQGQLRVGKS